MANLDINADILLDAAVAYDIRSKVVSISRLVFSATEGLFVQRVVSSLPDGKISRTKLYPTGSVSQAIRLLDDPSPATVELSLGDSGQTLSIQMQLDPENHSRFFFRASETVFGSGERLSEYCPWCIVAGIGIVAVGGLVGYGLHEGYDVDVGIGVDVANRRGHGGLKFQRHDDDSR